MVGAAAIIYRIARSGGRLLLLVADTTAVQGMAEVSARRGDITAMRERQAAVERLRRARAPETAIFFFWVLLLVGPLVFDVVQWVYPLATVVWFLPRRRSHRRRGGVNGGRRHRV